LKITPLEINKQEFKKSMRGYDPVEVDTFLEMLGNEFEKMISENKEYEKKVLELQTELKNFKEVERTLKQTLMNVQESSTKSRENSQKEADLMRKEAELTASEMIENAKRQTQALREEMVTLQTQKASLISRLRHVLTSQLELMDVLEMDDVDLSKLRDRTRKVFSAAKAMPEKTEIDRSAQEPEFSVRKPGKDDKKRSVSGEGEDQDRKVNSDLFKDVFGDDIDIENYTKE
jgi:cell division initiation protein